MPQVYHEQPADQTYLSRFLPLLEMATLCGAQALGFADATGSITAGKSADLVVLRSDEPSSADRWDQFLESTTPPQEVYIAGVPQLSGREALR